MGYTTNYIPPRPYIYHCMVLNGSAIHCDTILLCKGLQRNAIQFEAPVPCHYTREAHCGPAGHSSISRFTDTNTQQPPTPLPYPACPDPNHTNFRVMQKSHMIYLLCICSMVFKWLCVWWQRNMYLIYALSMVP